MIQYIRAQPWDRWLLWAVYLALLGVLLPHTAWAFGQFEPARWIWLGWIAAIAFEGAIAAFTWRLKEQIESSPRRKSALRRWRERYLNVYAAGLLVAVAISAAANWAHAVEFGQDFAVFGVYSVPPLVYAVGFGAILPFCSLLFARILADVQDSEQEQDESQAVIRQLRTSLHQAERRAIAAEQGARLLLDLTAEDKARRILTARERWPELPNAALAVIADASTSYVSEVLRREL
jgi:hypothetical protein